MVSPPKICKGGRAYSGVKWTCMTVEADGRGPRLEMIERRFIHVGGNTFYSFECLKYETHLLYVRGRD